MRSASEGRAGLYSATPTLAVPVIVHLGYDPVPGREGRIARNDYHDVPESLANLFKAAQAKPRIQPGKTD